MAYRLMAMVPLQLKKRLSSQTPPAAWHNGAGHAEPVADNVAAADHARDGSDWAAAAHHYAVALSLDPGRIDLHVQHGHALKELGDFEGAEGAYRRFLDLRPGDADIHLQFGHLCNRRDDLASALEWYQRAAQLAPEDADIAGHVRAARQHLASVTLGAKRGRAMRLADAMLWREARLAYHELVMADDQRDLIGILANVTKETGAFEEAASLYEQYRVYAEAEAPELLPDVELQVAHLHKAMGDFRTALRHYIRARNHHFEQTGDMPGGQTYDQEFWSCMNEIYTCFWDGRSR